MKITPCLLFILFFSCSKQTKLLNTNSFNNSTTEYAGTDIVGFNSYGQSLSVGGDGGRPNQVISATQLHNSVMFNLGLRTMNYREGAVPTSFVPLVEKVSSDGKMGETPCSGASDMFIQSYWEIAFQLFGCASGQSSQSVASLSKGGNYYQRLVNNITTANSIANGMNKTFSMGSIFWTQGEADYAAGTNYNDYRNKLLQLMKDANTDISSITGQQSAVPFIIGQCSSHNRTVASSTNPVVALADLDLALNEPNFTLATPMYQFTYLSDNTHLSDTNYRRLGAYYGYAFKKFLIDGVKNFIYPLSGTGAANTITLTFNVPVQPLVFDIGRIVNPGSFGFTALDAIGNKIKINSVHLLSGNSVQILCANHPSVIQYAINGQSKKAGPILGPRGCLRDSQGDFIVFDGYPLYNWTPIFSIKVN